MKKKKNPTKKQSIFIEKKGLNPQNWMIERDTPTEMVLVHKHFDNQVRIIHKEY